MTIKIAIPTDDGETISRHFGQAKSFKVIILENNQVVSSIMRAKASHLHGDHSQLEGVHPGQKMVETISDCNVLIAGGMGTPAFDRVTKAGLKVIMTGDPSIQDVIQAYLAGTLENDPALVHSH
jgi:predicted Fe-Mo cluster-binding NifX family protein